MKDDKKHIKLQEIGDLTCTPSNFEIKRVTFSIESEHTKPFDLSLMTGNNNQTESEDDEQ